MKKILSLLMCYVFLQAETFALRGGPNGAGAGKVTGSFSGIMLEKPDPADPATGGIRPSGSRPGRLAAHEGL